MSIYRSLVLSAAIFGSTLPGQSRSLRGPAPEACMARAPVVCLDTSTSAFRTERCGAERTAFSVARQACSAAFLSRPARPVPGGMRTPAPVETPAPGCNARIRYALCVGETVRPPAAVTGPACDADAPVDRCAKASARPDPALTAAGVRG